MLTKRVPILDDIKPIFELDFLQQDGEYLIINTINASVGTNGTNRSVD